MTDFMGLLEKGIEVLGSSNYDVLGAASELTWEGLPSNIGARFVGGFWLSFLLLLVLLHFVDRRLVHSRFFEILYKGLSDQKRPA